MSEVEVAVTGTIWESCLKFEKCIRIGWPINKKICVGVKACLRLIEQNGAVILQVDAAGKRFEYRLTNACHTIFTVAVGHIKICIEPRGGNSVRLQAKACIGYGPIDQCWDIWGTDIKWLTAAEFAALDLEPLDLPASAMRRARVDAVAVAFEDEFMPVGTCNCADEDAAVDA
ncbi:MULTISPECIES: hypothetical protein [unclassified Sphingomonas]|uniref:hypothetical protein n=1 Tax=unclassified Sphingomonas TaxID=196159 RepID=UPI0008377BAB|nr:MULTISPECIES: hypothetical protein [unclassified Sphingomonas]